jgi:uncharacterized membrane protein YeiB
MHELLQLGAAIIYCIIGFICMLLGATRGNRIKRINGEVIFFFIYFMALWYFMASWTSFKITDWERDDGIFDISLLRFTSGFTITVTFMSLIGYKIKQDALDAISYLFLCVFINVSLLISVLLYESDARMDWVYVAIIFTVILVIHSVRDTLHEKLDHARFVRTIILIVSAYIMSFIFTTLWSPLHQDLISFKTQEIVMVISDLLVSVLCAFSIIHYGWGLSPHNTPLVTPGYVTDIFKMNRLKMSDNAIRDLLHTF